MEVSRVYENSAGDVLRIDTIYMREAGSEKTTGPVQKVFIRDISTSLVLQATDRVVDSIQVVTDADSYDSVVSGPNNFTWVAWSAYGGARCNMSYLPIIGDTV